MMWLPTWIGKWHVTDWANANKLSLNINKTNYMIFHTKGKKFTLDLDVYISNKSVSRSETVKFLGVTTDLHYHGHSM